MWHEIVNDTIGGVPVAVTFCPLCNTGIAFERTFDGQMLDFGTTGRLRFSNLIMYDRQTETWWQQATGESIAGEHTGRRLTFVRASLISWADSKAAHPDGKMLSRDTGHARDYGRNPNTGYDDVNRSPFLYAGPETPDALPAMAPVVTVELNDQTVAYPYDVLQKVRVVNDTAGGVPIVALWAPGTASALDADSVARGNDVGAATTFSRELDGQALTFFFDGAKIVDEQTGSEWDMLGQAVSGSAAGSGLAPVVSINHSWFSWAALRPETRVYRAGQPAAAAPTADPETASVELAGDFDIAVYQGEKVLGGSWIKFSDLFALRRPVVLNLWAGLCPICRGEMPELQEAYEKYGDRVLFVGVDIGPFVGLGSEEDARTLLGQLKVAYPAGNMPDATIMRDYRVLGTPATYFFTSDGEIFQQWNGFLTGGQLGENIEALLVASSDTSGRSATLAKVTHSPGKGAIPGWRGCLWPEICRLTFARVRDHLCHHDRRGAVSTGHGTVDAARDALHPPGERDVRHRGRRVPGLLLGVPDGAGALGLCASFSEFFNTDFIEQSPIPLIFVVQ
jgi:thiol-disulfide isomerase/thioredoxin